MKTKSKFLNQNYFDIIDTEAKAYFLGWLWADGCNLKKGTSVGMRLQRKDRIILQKFSLELYNKDYVADIVTQPRENSKFNKCYYASELWIYSKYISKILLDMGMGNNKTFECQFPKIDINLDLWAHFLRGYFEGDGCISRRKGGSYKVHICGTKEFLDQLNLFVNTHLLINLYIKFQDNTYVAEFGGEIAEKFLDFIYKDAAFFVLQRKYKLYQDLKVWRQKFGRNSAQHKYIYKYRNTWMVNLYYPQELIKLQLGYFPTLEIAIQKQTAAYQILENQESLWHDLKKLRSLLE